jgi:hypothetical protein
MHALMHFFLGLIRTFDHGFLPPIIALYGNR